MSETAVGLGDSSLDSSLLSSMSCKIEKETHLLKELSLNSSPSALPPFLCE